MLPVLWVQADIMTKKALFNNMIASHRKGSILITVLIVISLCTSLALFIHQKAISSYSSVIALQTEYQGAIYAMTAVKALELAFKYDTDSSDGKEDIWNIIPPIPVEKGFLTVYIKPLNSKFPLNILASDNDTRTKRYEDGFVKLMEELNMDTGRIDDLKNWLGSGIITSERFDENNTPYSFKGNKLDTLAELQYIPAFADDFKDLSEYISIGDTDYKINMNIASKEVIIAVLPELEPFVEDIIQARDTADFKNVSDIYNIVGAVNQDMYNKILPFFDVKSSLFYAKLELDAINEYRYYHILFQRNGKSIKVLKYIEGPNVEYF